MITFNKYSDCDHAPLPQPPAWPEMFYFAVLSGDFLRCTLAPNACCAAQAAIFTTQGLFPREHIVLESVMRVVAYGGPIEPKIFETEYILHLIAMTEQFERRGNIWYSVKPESL
ncbi:hypothetical protein [Bythopirellula polymerisocia]|uniref:Uncharacterized protein n=1 Tax=Bythopirellula polymerisocia TaxID=2528003 RepID=A0A5C6CY82_9BACT|nr:hypothetical protein [Bythopirellula polymerisocia]TWU27599.1 hypothetical protein Pla144_23760 [Bythopirellula polymerisocia]